MVRSKSERKLRYQHVHDLVLTIMAEHDLKPGDRLPSTVELAEIAAVTALISISVGLPCATIATVLGIDSGQPVWEIWRKRTLGSADNILERAVLPLRRVPAIDRGLLAEGGSLYRFIEERYDLDGDFTEQAFEVDTPAPGRPSSWEWPPTTRSCGCAE
jgi:DNA-binding GntR family transcriptional regulator